MATRDANVNLIIKARDEAGQAIEAVSDALAGLLGVQNDVGKSSVETGARLTQLGTTISALDKAYAASAAQGERASAAFERQALAAGKAVVDLANARETADGIRNGLARLKAEADAAFVGPQRPGLGNTIKGVERDLRAADAAVAKLSASLTTQQSNLTSSRSSLTQLGSTINAIAEAQAKAHAEVDANTAAYNRQTAAVRAAIAEQQRAATNGPAAQSFFNAKAAPGLVSGAATANGAGFSALEEQFTRLEAEAAQVRAAIDPIGEAVARARVQIERVQTLARGGFLGSADAISREVQIQNALSATIAQLNGSAAAEKERAAEIASAAAIAERARTDEARAADAANKTMESEATALRAALDPLAAVQLRFNEQLERYRTLAAAGKITTAELAAAEAHLTAEANKTRVALQGAAEAASGGGKNKIGLLGLKPYELQNLGYQVNDVATQLASGTSLTQTLAQQGGQILQLFPKVGSAIVAAVTNPAILAFVATIGAIGVGLYNAAEQAGRLREFTNSLNLRSNGGDYNAKALADQAKALEHLGASAADADDAIKTLLDHSVNPASLATLARVSQETAEALGIKLPEAAKQVADAFTGGYDAIAKYDDKLNFLSATERDHIRQLFQEGNAQAARTEALNAYARQVDGVARNQRGPWGEAARSLGLLWDSLTKAISNSIVVRGTIAVFDGLANAIKGVSDALVELHDGAPAGSGGGASALAQKQSQIKQISAEIAEYEHDLANLDTKQPNSAALKNVFTQGLVAFRDQLARAQAELATLEKSAPDTQNGSANSLAAKQRADRLASLTIEAQLQDLRDRGQQGLNAADSKRREQLAGQIAFNKEIEASGDRVVAARLRETEVAKETAAVDKQNEAARKQAATEREQEISKFEGRVVGAEGGAGKNPNSTAAGFGQFTEGTFRAQFAKVYPEMAKTLSDASILALRGNETVAKGIIDNYARENAKFLESFGAKVTAGNLYLAHFLGPAGAKAVLTAAPSTPVDQLLSQRVRDGNKAYLRTDGGKGRYRTAGELQTFIGGRVGDTGTPQSAGQAAINKLIEDAEKHQDDFNEAVKRGNDNRQRTIEALTSEAGLQGASLIAEQRKQAVTAAEFTLRKQLEDANNKLKPGESAVELTQAQIDKTRELAAAEFDLQHAREVTTTRLADQQRPLDDLQAQKDIVKSQVSFLRSIGENNAAATLEKSLVGLDAKIGVTIDNLIAFYRALTPKQRVELGIVDTAQLDNVIAKLQQAKQGAQEFGKVAGLAGEDVAKAFASSAVSAFTSFLDKVEAGQNVFSALGDSVLSFAASFASAIAQMILQLLAYAAAVSILRALNVPVPQSGGIAGVFHTGGIAGQGGGERRNVDPAWFAGAMRYHTGGIAGLAADEVPAVLERGEEVLREDNPRHRNNVGSGNGSAGASPLKIVNAFDTADVVSHGLSTAPGEQAVLNVIRRNRSAIKGALG